MKVKINLRVAFLALWVISFGFETRYIVTLANYGAENISRQFGSFIFINLQIVFAFALIALSIIKNYSRIRINKKRSVIMLFFLPLLARVMMPVYVTSYIGSVVGGINILIQFISAMALLNMCTCNELWKALDIGFLVLLVIEIAIGILTYAGISIPFFTAPGEGFGIRSGWLRMQGSLKHPASLSFLMVFIFLFYATKFFYKKERISIIWMILAYIGIYFTFARTALIVSSLLLVILLWIYYRKKVLVKVLMFLVLAVLLVNLALSDWFNDMFVDLSISDMFQARFIHWIIGWRIMTADIFNFLLGVGINNNVDYIRDNYYQLVSNLPTSAILTGNFVTANPIHNSYFIIGAEAGIGTMIVYGYTLLKMALDSIKMLLKNKYRCSYKFAFILFAVLWYAIYAMQGWGALDELGVPMLCLIMVLYEKEVSFRQCNS